MVLWKIENSFDGKWEPVDIRTKINRVDFGGSAILVSAVFSLLFGLSLGGERFVFSPDLGQDFFLHGAFPYFAACSQEILLLGMPQLSGEQFLEA